MKGPARREPTATRERTRASPGSSRAATARRNRGFGTALLVALTGASLLPHGGEAQSTVVDQGAFLLSREGQAIGTERFVIRSTSGGSGPRFLATGELELELPSGPRHITSAVEIAPPDLTVQAYQIKVSGDRRHEVYLVRSDRRLQARVVSSEGEELREFRARPGLLVLDEGIVHHYHFFVARVDAPEGTEIPTLVPLASTERTIRIVEVGTERLAIAGVTVSARRFELEDRDGRREVWADDAGRILRVEDHATGFRAERRDLPD